VSRGWITRTVVGIIIATFFSDVSHEMVTAVLPLYLGSIGMGAAALALIEGTADFTYSLSKLGGGYIGHRVEHKKPWVTAGYFITSLGTGLMAIVHSVAGLVGLRTVAWVGRGIRAPMRDFMLSDEVQGSHYGRAYGVERTADMIGALIGPLIAAVLVFLGASFKVVILVSIIPSMLAALSISALARDKTTPQSEKKEEPAKSEPLPRAYWLFTGGVLLFGLGDFSRTFLIVLATRVLGGSTSGLASTAVLLYAGHSLVSAIAAYPAGILGDKLSKRGVLIAGYALGVVTNLIFAFGHDSLPIVIGAIALSGVYIAVEETLEKASVAELLPRSQRSKGLGILAAANALGDFGSTIFVGFMLSAGHATTAFVVPAIMGALGVLWMLVIARVRRIPDQRSGATG
jgi:MFS family permease